MWIGEQLMAFNRVGLCAFAFVVVSTWIGVQLLAFNKEGVQCSCIPSCMPCGYVCYCRHSKWKRFSALAHLVVIHVDSCADVGIQ